MKNLSCHYIIKSVSFKSFSLILDVESDTEEEDSSKVKTPAEMIKDAAKLMMESVMPIINEKLALRDAAILEKLECIEVKISMKENQSKPDTSKETACYYCREPGHIASACALRIACFGCGANSHPLSRCHFRESKCSVCGETGHTDRIHNTKDEDLRIKLLMSNPKAFGHFASCRDKLPTTRTYANQGSSRGAPGTRGSRGGRGSRGRGFAGPH